MDEPIIDITLVTTGGTIDGADSDLGTSRHLSDAAKWLQDQRNIRLVHIPLLNKDSRLINDGDRRQICDAVHNSTSAHVLVTHGTFTICETGRALKAAREQLSNLLRTVLLVGAWVPFGEKASDAPEQLQFAVRKLREGPAGVWIAMDGKLWNPDTTRKIQVTQGVYRLSALHAN